MKKNLILASASPRRLELLKQMGVVPDQVIPADIDEAPRLREIPGKYTIRMASEKAAKVFNTHKESFILSADTVVAVGRRILPKAETAEETLACLQLLSGRSHAVLTAVCVVSPSGVQKTKLVISKVKFKRLSVDEIDSYISTKEWKGKAGGYGIQGKASALISYISGSYTGIVGLPLYETVHLLKGLGYDPS